MSGRGLLAQVPLATRPEARPTHDRPQPARTNAARDPARTEAIPQPRSWGGFGLGPVPGGVCVGRAGPLVGRRADATERPSGPAGRVVGARRPAGGGVP